MRRWVLPFVLTGLRCRWHREKGPRLVGDILEVDEAAAFSDDVEEIAMLAGGRVGPFAGGTFRRVLEPDIHRAAGCVARIAHEPVVALAATAGKIMPAHRLGLPAETVR